jgi:acetyl-CoA/propionyl-CoA carboxylase biotin carboxyl carrier protein
VKDAIGPNEAARRLGVSPRTVQRWLRDGRLPAVSVGKRVKVDASAFASEPSAARIDGRQIGRLLVANRGELVVRIARTCRQLGIQCLALVPEDQARAWWTRAADEIVPLNGSYLDPNAVLAAARASHADAIHPGYGFLAENADFAQAVVEAGLAWVGPSAAAMRALGDKAAARRLAAQLGVPLTPGYDGDDQADDRLRSEAERIGYPVLLKPSAGGGGKGMHVVRDGAAFIDALAQARREASVAFGDERMILERYVEQPRHIEVQILADMHGNAVHLGERECTLQRRHQKVIEEAPSPVVNAALRDRLGNAALRLVRAAQYVGAGTAEFLLDRNGDFYFLEVNARLQVEHPVTELVTGRDLVADQLRIAAGGELGFAQADVRFDGHAIEARLYAEDPYAGFLPATGEVRAARWPVREGLRVDAGVGDGDVVGTRYDPLLAKLITWAPDRKTAVAALDHALGATAVLGVTTNRGFLRWLLGLPQVIAADMHTGLIDELWHGRDELPDEAWTAPAPILASGERSGFRLNAPRTVRVEIGEEARAVPLTVGHSAVASVRVGDEVLIDLDGRSVTARLAPAPTVEAAISHAAHEGSASARVVAPMPGTVIAVRVEEGADVEAGQVLVVLEAMKMENTVAAPAPGRVAKVLVQPGQQVQRSETLVELT